MQESEKSKWSRSISSTLCDPMDCRLPGSSSHGIFQARVLEWGAIAFSDSVLYSDVNGKEIQKKRGYTYILIHFVIQQKLKWASLVAQTVTNPPTKQETWVRALDREGPLKKWKATHSSILTWRIPWTEESDELQSMGLQRVGHDRVTTTFQKLTQYCKATVLQ